MALGLSALPHAPCQHTAEGVNLDLCWLPLSTGPPAVGTSTGGLLAVALGLRQLDMDDCTYIYKVLGQKVFSRIVAAKDSKEESWMEVRPGGRGELRWCLALFVPCLVWPAWGCLLLANNSLQAARQEQVYRCAALSA